MEILLANNSKMNIPHIEVNESNAFGLIIATKIALGKYEEKRRTEKNQVILAFLNSVIYRCNVALGREEEGFREINKKIALRKIA